MTERQTKVPIRLLLPKIMERIEKMIMRIRVQNIPDFLPIEG